MQQTASKLCSWVACKASCERKSERVAKPPKCLKRYRKKHRSGMVKSFCFRSALSLISRGRGRGRGSCRIWPLRYICFHVLFNCYWRFFLYENVSRSRTQSALHLVWRRANFSHFTPFFALFSPLRSLVPGYIGENTKARIGLFTDEAVL